MNLFRNYIKEVRQHSTKLYIAILIIGTITILTNATRTEFAPFYVFSMYSSPPKEKQIYVVFEVEMDNEIWKEHTFWGHHGRIQILYTLQYYYNTIQNDSIPVDAKYYIQKHGYEEWLTSPIYKNYTSLEDIRRFPQWLKQYLNSILNKEASQMKIFSVYVQYKEDGSLEEVKRELLCQA